MHTVQHSGVFLFIEADLEPLLCYNFSTVKIAQAYFYARYYGPQSKKGTRSRNMVKISQIESVWTLHGLFIISIIIVVNCKFVTIYFKIYLLSSVFKLA